jgi:F0F1-type ATP synthase epsilon subunit
MKLRIVSPTKSTNLEVVWLEINTPDGNFIIQNGYISTTFLLAANKELSYCFKTGKQESVAVVKGGILEVTKQEVIVLLKE